MIPNSKLSFFWIAASVADTAALNLNDTRTLLANVLSTFFAKGKSVVSNDARRLPENYPNWIIWESWVFNKFILADELFAKGFPSIETCQSVNINL